MLFIVIVKKNCVLFLEPGNIENTDNYKVV